MRTLVVVEHEAGRILPATQHAVGAAQRLGAPVDLLLASAGETALVAAACGIAGAAKVLRVDAPYYAAPTPENLAALVVRLAPDYTHVVASAGALGKSVMPRVAALLDVAPVTDVIAIEAADCFVRPIYAGNAWETLRVPAFPAVLTIRPTAFEPGDSAAVGEAETVEVVTLPPEPDLARSRVVWRQVAPGGRAELSTARVVVAGGRGLGNAEQFKALLEPLAEKLEAALGATRAAVDGGFIANEYQVGQTGKIVAPELYIAIGIAGAIQHVAGMKESRIVVAINKDAEAPIFQVADYGLVADLFDAVPALIEALGR